jgi:hypothetical protein
MSKLKINTFGEGIEIRKLNLDSTSYQHWSEIALRKNKLLPDLLLDPFFYYDLRDVRITELSDIDSTLINGMMNTTKGQIEIWHNRRKVLKIKAHELFNTNVLFRLFHLKESHSFISGELDQGIYVIQKTIGLIRQEELLIINTALNIDDFTFMSTDFQSIKFLTDIQYQKEYFTLVKSETTITYQTAFEIK